MKRLQITTTILFTVLTAVALVLNITITKNKNKPPEIEIITPKPIVSDVAITDFSNTVFIGDSRTQGLMMFGGITEATYYVGQGITVHDVIKKPLVKKENEEITIIEALKENSFDNIMIMLGINELGWAYTDLFREAYSAMLDQIIIDCPNSNIYVQLVMPVNRSLIENPKDYINNDRIIEYNNVIKEICNGKGIKYIDTFNLMCNKDGDLYKSASTDGIHLNMQFCKRWVNFMKGATVYEIFE